MAYAYGYSGGEDESTLRQKRDAYAQQQAASANAYRQQEIGRENHERSLQSQEQQRRQYDSASAREGQQQKWGVLGGLLKGLGNNSGMSGYSGRMAFGQYGRRN